MNEGGPGWIPNGREGGKVIPFPKTVRESAPLPEDHQARVIPINRNCKDAGKRSPELIPGLLERGDAADYLRVPTLQMCSAISNFFLLNTNSHDNRYSVLLHNALDDLDWLYDSEGTPLETEALDDPLSPQSFIVGLEELRRYAEEPRELDVPALVHLLNTIRSMVVYLRTGNISVEGSLERNYRYVLTNCVTIS